MKSLQIGEHSSSVEESGLNEQFWEQVDPRRGYSIVELQSMLHNAGIVKEGRVGKLETLIYVASAYVAGKKINQYRRVFINPQIVNRTLQYKVFIY